MRLPDITPQWRSEMADVGFTEEQVQGIEEWIRMELDSHLLDAADTLEAAGWTVEPPARSDGPGCGWSLTAPVR